MKSAFPTTQYLTGVSPSGHDTGMTLRDYFAAKALQVFLANDKTDWCDDVHDAYAVADKMLAEREK